MVQTAPVVINLTLGSLVLAVVFGLVIALVRIARIPVLRQIATVIVEILRGTPLLVQLVYILLRVPQNRHQYRPDHLGHPWFGPELLRIHVGGVPFLD